jgi:hypothetical protein
VDDSQGMRVSRDEKFLLEIRQDIDLLKKEIRSNKEISDWAWQASLVSTKSVLPEIQMGSPPMLFNSQGKLSFEEFIIALRRIGKSDMERVH